MSDREGGDGTVARGTSTRGKKLSIRLTEEDYNKLSDEAKNNNISISEYGRQKLNGTAQNTGIQICKYSTALNKIISKYSIAQEDKDFLSKETRSIWQYLK